MDEITREDFERYLEAQKQWTEAIGKVNHPTAPNNSSSSQALFNVNAGNPAMWIAVWISTICCAVVVTMTWNWREDQTKQMVSVAEQARKLDNANDKLSIILQWAPKLAKEVDDEMKQKEIENAHHKP